MIGERTGGMQVSVRERGLMFAARWLWVAGAIGTLVVGSYVLVELAQLGDSARVAGDVGALGAFALRVPRAARGAGTRGGDAELEGVTAAARAHTAALRPVIAGVLGSAEAAQRMDRISAGFDELANLTRGAAAGGSSDAGVAAVVEAITADADELLRVLGAHSEAETRSLGTVVWTGMAALMVGLAVTSGGVRWAERRTNEARSRERAAEERYRRLVATSQNGIGVIDARGRVTFWNAALLEMTGYEGGELAGLPAVALVHPDCGERLAERRRSRLRGEPLSPCLRLRLVRGDGSALEAEATVTALAGEDGEPAGTLIELRDVTEETRLKEELTRAQKREALGRLVAGVAHDFNNLLTAIGGSIELARQDAEDRDRWFSRAEIATDRAAELVRQIGQFSRSGPPERAPVDVENLVQETVALARATFDRAIALDVQIACTPPRIMADRGQLQQVLLNLLLNARDAVAERLATADGQRQQEGQEGYAARICVEVTALERAPGEQGAPRVTLRLRVADNGTGMAPEVRERIFDPFFTTKSVDKGTGLGLSTVHGIVVDSGGTIDVDSAPGEGAIFTISLPVAEAAAAPAAGPAEAPEVAHGPPERGVSVLFVDDEETLREMAQLALSRAGYQTVVAPGGAEALREVEGRRFDVAIVDVNMPPPNGWTTLAQLKQFQPDLCVLMSSGYAVAGEATARGACGLLAKPYNRDGLLRTVSEALAEHILSKT